MYRGCILPAEESWADGCCICNILLLCLPREYSKESVGEGGAILEIQEDVAACAYDLGPFQVLMGEVSEVRLNSMHCDPIFHSAIPDRNRKEL